MKAFSIRGRLTRAILAIFFVVVTVGVGAIYALVRQALVRQFDVALLTKAQAISALVRWDGTIEESHFSDRIMRDFDEDSGDDCFELWRSDGTVATRSKSLGQADLPRLPEIGAKPGFRHISLPDGRLATEVNFVFSPRPRDEEDEAQTKPQLQSAVPALQLAMATAQDDLDELLAKLAWICGATVLMLSAAALLIPSVLRRLLRPLDRLATQTSAIDAKSLATRLPMDGLPAELLPIAECLNDLFARLERSFDRERRVTADLAHELRTPLAEMKTWVGSALKWPDSRDPATDREVMDAAQHMEAIVTRMLALARSELGKIPLAVEAVDVPRLLEHTWKGFEPRAAAKSLRVEWALAAGKCETDPVLLRSILTNLFENAVEYAPMGGAVRIGSVSESDGISIYVANTASNLSREDVTRFFERFWRKEESRSGEQHFGLGLAIAQSFAQSLGWHLGATLGEDRLLTLVLTSAPVERPSATK